LLCDCNENPEREIEMLRVLDEKRVDGVIVAAPRMDSRRLLPAVSVHQEVVIINRQFETQNAEKAIGYVFNDDQDGGYKATRLLLEQGHAQVGFLAGPKASYGSQRRMRGYCHGTAGTDFEKH